jgi:hypothetical protein
MFCFPICLFAFVSGHLLILTAITKASTVRPLYDLLILTAITKVVPVLFRLRLSVSCVQQVSTFF